MGIKSKILAVSSVLLLGGLCGVYLYSCFAPPQDTPCVPIDYPNGKTLNIESTKIFTFETNAKYSDVVDFYRTNLKFDKPIVVRDDEIRWVEHPIRNIGILFECGSLIQRDTTELGCIFVSQKDQETVIETMWSYVVDGPSAPCYMLPGIKPEDYLQIP